MSAIDFTVLAVLAIFFPSFCVDSFGLEMVSNYAKVFNHATDNSSTAHIQSPNNVTMEYEDFDDIQEEEENRSMDENSGTNKMMKYFNGIVNLLALMHKFNGRFDGLKHQSLHFQSSDQSTKADTMKVTGKHFQKAEDRFEFPQKKFKYSGMTDANTIDQQNQPIENYPPYNPNAANSAETYNKDDKKTSYDLDLQQYDSNKNDVQIQQSYSYEIPYESSKPSNPQQNDWTNQIHPVYHSWMSNDHASHDQTSNDWQHSYEPSMMNDEPTGNEDSFDSYQPWKTQTTSKPLYKHFWQTIADKPKPVIADPEPSQPWKDKHPSIDFPVYHHDTPHLEYHEVDDHLVDEDRVSKKPYSYYFLGRKLWYIPLLFSVYFIIYIGALVLKSVARHKIQFPEKVWNLHDEHFGHGKHRRHRKIDEITENYEKAIEKLNNKFM